MEPENQPGIPGTPLTVDRTERSGSAGGSSEGPLFSDVLLQHRPEEPGGMHWIFLGSQGLRAGWSAAVFILLTFLFMVPLSFLANLFSNRVLHSPKGGFSPLAATVQEAVALLAIVGAGSIVAFIERRRLLDYNLTGPRRTRRFVEGLFAGFLALSVLVGEMVAGGWLHFGAVALSGMQIASYAALWAVCFMLVGLFEEGAFRCYLQFPLTRGINFWWALAVEAGLCIDLALREKGNGVWGVYAVALLGLLPCLLLELRKAQGAGFWQAAWVTSTVFGFIHTGNNGENWIGIFAAGAIGFVFCVSIWVTGSAWWAIGCHAGWDWAETYFYGTADSGLQAQGHYLTTNPAGNVLWSGGADGPEGSLLVLGVILLLLLALLAIYGRRRAGAAVS
jgi:membrane protease YdiL (CAAX protease family)